MVRSVLWPVFILPVTLALTILFINATRSPSRIVAVPLELDASVQAALEADGFEPTPHPEPVAAVDAGDVVLATDGSTVWTTDDAAAVALEESLRRHHGSGWVFHVQLRHPGREANLYFGGLALRPLAMLFVLYSLVFSLGAISRDRDAEILDAERSLPIPDWGPVMARWIAAIGVLAPTHAVAVLLMQLVMPTAHPYHFVLRGTGAIAAAAAIGVAVAGGQGRQQGFGGPFAVGSIAVAAAVVVGSSVPGVQKLLPLCTLLTDARGEPSLLLGLLAGPIGAAVHVWRDRRAL